MNITRLTIALLSLSFWSSGVFLIRTLGAYGMWNNGFALVALFLLSIPLVYISIVSVKSIFAKMGKATAAPLEYIIAWVVVLHVLFLSLYPGVYGFAPSPTLTATAWLLWFGGIAFAAARFLE